MINEFHAALVNKRFASGHVGEDYIDPAWQERSCSQEATTLRRVLLQRPHDPASCNWRSVEIRRMLKRSDLLSCLLSFDPRTGYQLDDLLRALTDRLRPQITSGDSSEARVIGKFEGDAYLLANWQIETSGLDWTIRRDGKEWSGTRTTLNERIPIVGSSASFAVKTDGSYLLTWAAKPRIGMGQIAKQLRTSHGTNIEALSRQKSRLPAAVRETLRNIAIYDGESPAQVCAVALLVAGHTLGG